MEEGTPFGRYRLISLLGRGGMGEVWRAHDTDTDRVVAIKVLPAEASDNEEFTQRFRREAHAAARLNTPHVIPIHHYGEIDGRLYVDMRLIEGQDLHAALAAGPMEPRRAVRIIEQVATALQAAHKVGLIHRDVKPSNILLDENDFAYLIDFGIARTVGDVGLTGTGDVIGTWPYMAPERFSTGEPDARADIYALACVLYECLTCERPFPGDTVEQQVAGHLSKPPPRPSLARADVPAELDHVIAAGMAKDPNQRYATTVELATAAQNAVTTPIARPAGAAPATVVGPVSHAGEPATQRADAITPRRSRKWLWATVAGLTVVALVAGIVVALLGRAGDEDAVRAQSTTTPADAGPPPGTEATPTPGPFTGSYTAVFGPVMDLNDQPVDGVPPTDEVWNVRSVCRESGCVAAAARASGDMSKAPTMVFDEIGGRWVAVADAPFTCFSGKETAGFVSFTLQPGPDGSFAGEYVYASSTAACAGKRAVTFTRTGDPQGDVGDPAVIPAREASPAEGLNGRYQRTTLFTDGRKSDAQFAVRTYCLRGGDRCISTLAGEERGYKIWLPLVFTTASWSLTQEFDSPCTGRGEAHVTDTATYLLPQPPSNPIAVLTGIGRRIAIGACTGGDFTDKLERTGD